MSSNGIEWQQAMKSALSFTYDGYRVLLRYLKQRYVIIPVCDYKPGAENKLMLRHDVDGAMEPAVRMAHIENEMGLRSTYCFLFSARYYNLFEESALKQLREITNYSHEIGLHYDIVQYDRYRLPCQDTLKRELELLGELAGRPIRTMARHNVSLSGYDPFQGYTDPINVYNDAYFTDARYVSDSCRAWYLRDLESLLTQSSPTVQVLIHPMLWRAEECTRDEALMRFFEEIRESNDVFKAKWLNLWHSADKVVKFEDELKKMRRSIDQ